MKKSKLLMVKKETRIVHIHSANEEKKSERLMKKTQE
jgi:hypothetical protein